MSEIVRGRAFASLFSNWPLIAVAVVISLLGVVTMHPFVAGGESLAPRQLLWIAISTAVYFICSFVDMRFLRRTPVIISLYFGVLALLIVLLLVVSPVQGAKSWFSLGPFSFQPSDPAKIVIIALIAKYFSRRHTEIGQFWHVIVSGAYTGAVMLVVLVQPDLGTAAIMGIVWFGMILVSGISKKHLAIVFATGLIAAGSLWTFALHDYQKARIMTFINPAADIHGSGYNAYQAMVAVGSGEVTGKGIGYGTQSKLRFLPEYETDFIFASFAEEWGFMGIVLLLSLYSLLLFYLVSLARRAATNFDALFTIGVAILLLAHLGIHAGINMGLLPVTGTTIPFMSYGGSHLLVEFAALGIVASLARDARSVPREFAGQEYEG
ncbi:rod shape-determining protein RodA [Patescibacteria group bacterium]|nr:rod shape-determining protein RodA [Patescibacteria group bacterium]MBU1755044.1 rod shape-determining protein RodA [Patescibacteria group bacterium]